MAKILDMPKLSPTMEEGVLSAWHKKEGDEIGVDDLLAEVETDKAMMEFRLVRQGNAAQAILVPPGTQVKLGQPVAVIGQRGEDVSALAAQATAANVAAVKAPAAPPAAGPSEPAAAARPIAPTQPPPPETIAPPAQRKPAVGNVLDRTSYFADPGDNGATPSGGRVLASPYVRKTAREMGIDFGGGSRDRPARPGLACRPRWPARQELRRPGALAERGSSRGPPGGAFCRLGGSAALADAQDHRAPPHRVEANGSPFLSVD